MIKRPRHLKNLRYLLSENRVVAILGPRQTGKTTLARMFAQQSKISTTFFDLENPRDLARLSTPMLALENLGGIVVLDEIQRRPELFPVLRVLADKPSGPKFLVLGSASPELLRQASETLAGRLAFYQLGGFALDEVGENYQKLWLKGGFPRSFIASSDRASADWRRNFIQTFLERDIPQLGITIPSSTLWRFWSMIAHYHGQIWNSSEFARAFGVTDRTVRHYMDVLTSTFMLRQLLPWHENLSKRQVRAPKIYIADTGILHTLLDIESIEDIEGHPKVGASWESFCLQSVIEHLGARPEQCFFWATHGGAELDLFILNGNTRRGFEFKRTDVPTVTRSMEIALNDLHIDSLDIIYPGKQTFYLTKQIRAVGLSRLLIDVKSPHPAENIEKCR